MRRSRIYHDQPLAANTELALTSRSAHYLYNVLRCKAGQSLTVFDGAGSDYAATIADCSRKAVTVQVHDTIETRPESPLLTRVGLAMARGERMDWAIQKCTELGATTIQLVDSERSEVRLDERRLQKRLQHWQGVVISACEQCGRSVLPTLSGPTTLSGWASDCDAERKLVLDPNGAQLDVGATSPASVALLSGPEGGLTEAEVSAVEAQGFSRIAIGPRILRAETAPLIGLGLVQAAWGDLR